MSLKKAATSSVKWSSISQVARQVMQFVTIAIFANLLSPEDFGLVGMATIVIGFIDLFKDLGTSAAVIQRKNISDELLYSIFWINVFFGTLGSVILFFGSPLVALFYQEPEINLILKVLSLSFFLSGISILQKAILEKKLAFNTLAKIEIVAIFAGSCVGITLAFLGFGVWSLVTQTLTVVTVTTILLWASTRWKPKMIFRWSEVKEVSSYSLNLTGFNSFNYFVRNADYLLIGKFLGSQSLGYYTLAYRLMLYPIQNISHVISRVMFPVFSQIQDDNAKLRTAYLKVVGMISVITFPIMFGLWALAEPFILTVFGNQWQPVILLLMILVPVGMSQSLETTVGTIYQTKGRTDWMFRFSLVEGTVFVTAWIIGLRWGIYGVATAYAVGYSLLVYPNYAIPFSLVKLPVIELAKVISRPLLASSIMLLVLLGLKFMLLINLPSAWILGILIPIGGITYLAASWLINRNQIQQLFSLVGLKG
ncbi:MAG: MOP flippase family protein [Symploca sp. SIO3E6]|nr:MOP flippase family protein [Caldora sp. SIO3E6]